MGTSTGLQLRFMHDLTFDFHGIALRLVADSSAVIGAAQFAFKPFRVDCLQGDILDLRVETCSSAPRSTLSTAAKLVSDTFRTRSSVNSPWICSLYREPSGVRSAYFPDYALLRVFGREGVLILLRAALSDAHLICSVLRFGVFELIKTRGLFPIHGAALEKNGVGVLVAGPSSTGKTRSCLALLCNRWHCISNETAVVREREGMAEVLPFDSENDASESVASNCPDLSGTLYSRPPKRRAKAEVNSADQSTCTRVCAVLFPQLVDAEESRLEAIPRSRALIELLPQSVLVFDSDLARSHFDLLARLIGTSRCYRLHCGGNVHHLPFILKSSLMERPNRTSAVLSTRGLRS